MTPAERLRKNQRMLDKAIRELDQVRVKLEKQEKTLVGQIRQSAQKGQMGAAQALGMTYGQTMRLIILPQAFRKMTPLLLQQSIILFQDTSLVYTVGLVDFLNSARSNGDIIGRSHEFLIFAGVVYFLISFSASWLVKRLQKRIAV